jgi:hypothetical protein
MTGWPIPAFRQLNAGVRPVAARGTAARARLPPARMGTGPACPAPDWVRIRRG